MVNARKAIVAHRNVYSPAHAAQPVMDRTERKIERVHGAWNGFAVSISLDATIKSFKILPANMGNNPGTQHSLINDEGLQDYGLLVITEPSYFVRDDGRMWRQAKIIALRKSFGLTTLTRRPTGLISLLPTLAKALESVVAERLAYLAKTMFSCP